MGSKTFWTRTNTILEQFYLRFQTYNFNMQICYGPVIDAILLSKWYRTFLDSLIPLRKIYIIYNETYFICCIKIKHLSKWVCGGGGGGRGHDHMVVVFTKTMYSHCWFYILRDFFLGDFLFRVGSIGNLSITLQRFGPCSGIFII